MIDSFSIDIVIRHPSCEPSHISQELGLKPNSSWKKGDIVPGIRAKRATAWYCEFLRDNGTEAYENALRRVISFINKKKAFFKEIGDEKGEAEIVLNHSVEFDEGRVFELSLSPIFLGHLSTLGIGLHITGWGEGKKTKAKLQGKTGGATQES
jgi:hypothetical protein